MADQSHIEWTDATWNPVTGCDRVSPGCDNCYALTLAKRLKAMGSPGYQNDGDPRTSGPGFALTLHPDRLDQPLRWTKPRRIFVNSMSDLFHPAVPVGFIRSVWEAMEAAPQHTFQVLTKRPQRLRTLFRDLDGHTDPIRALPNVWVGTSIESFPYGFRANHLRDAPAAIRFLSLEPLLGPLPDPSLDLTDIDWVIVGGESGPGARPMHVAWVRDIRDRCVEAGIAFYFKQWGEFGPAGSWRGPDHHLTIDGHLFMPGERLGMNYMAQPVAMHRWGKKAAGRLLDGRIWDEVPA